MRRRHLAESEGQLTPPGLPFADTEIWNAGSGPLHVSRKRAATQVLLKRATSWCSGYSSKQLAGRLSACVPSSVTDPTRSA